MLSKLPILCFMIFFGGALAAFGQIEAATPNGRPQKEELPKNIQETLAKQRIEREKKDFDELVQKTEEAVKLSRELEKSFAASNQLSAEDRKKLERLEKLVKKIRDDLGADDDEKTDADAAVETPSTLGSAFQTLKTNAAELLDEIKKTTRYSISVIAVQTSNSLLKIVKFIRFGK